LAKYLRKRNVAINGIIDNNYLEKTNEEFEVIPFDAVEDGAKIFIAISKKESNIAIERQIRSRHRRTTIVKFSDLVNAMDWDTYDM
jgi:hypothetical protein